VIFTSDEYPLGGRFTGTDLTLVSNGGTGGRAAVGEYFVGGYVDATCSVKVSG
jgi:hypothetical protein